MRNGDGNGVGKWNIEKDLQKAPHVCVDVSADTSVCNGERGRGGV
jgi:hypothetical protein